MTSVASPRRPCWSCAARVALAGAGILAAVTVLSFVGPALLIVAIVPAVVLIPAGLAYGAVGFVLVRRARHAAGGASDPPSARAHAASAFRTRSQVVDERFHAVVLGVLTLGSAFVVALLSVDTALSDSGYVFNDTSPLGDALGAAGGVASSVLVLLLAAIPIAAVLTTRQLADADRLIGEARALRSRTGAWRRIRRARALADVDLALGSLAALAVITAALLSSIRP